MDPADSLPFGARVAAVSARAVNAGFEQFTVGFTMPEAEPGQGLYRIAMQELPEHALLLVPRLESDGSIVFDATFNRRIDA